MPHRIHTAHHIKGRIRLKIPGAKGNPAVLTEIQKSVAGLDGVTGIQTNPSTGSIVVNYNPTFHADFHQRLTSHGESEGSFLLAPPELSEVDETARMIEQEAEFLAQHSETARVIVSGFKSLDNGLKRATGNTVDLKVLLPLGLAAYSFIEIGLEASTPLWVTLGIFSFNSFITLHSSQEKVKTERDVVVKEPVTESEPPSAAAEAPEPAEPRRHTRKGKHHNR